MAAFSITSAQPSARLPITRRGRLDFTVTNTAHRELTARAHVVPEGGAQEGWFTIVGPQRDSPADATHQFGVEVAVPIEARPGSYRFRLDVVGVEDPDEYEAEGVWATIDVPLAPQPSRLPIWIIAIAAVLLVAIAVAVVLKVRGPARANLEVSANSLSFNNIPVGQGSPGSLVTVKNSGSADAKVTVRLAGADPSDFKVLVSTCAGAPLAQGATCQFQVGFEPTAQGSRSALLEVTAPNAAKQPPLTVTGTGQGTAAAVVFSPATVALSAPRAVAGGTDPPVATVVTIKNNGQTPFTIATVKLVESNPLVGPSFQLVSACDGVTLSGGQTCQVAVVFTHTYVTRPPLGVSAQDANSFSGQLLVVDDAPGTPQSVPISGTRR